MSDELDVNPMDIAEGEELPLPEGGEETTNTAQSFSFFDGTPLSNSEPNDPIDDVDGYRLGPEYGKKYLQRGVNKLIQSNTPAWLDLSLAGINGLYTLFGTVGGGGNTAEEESNTTEDSEINIDK